MFPGKRVVNNGKPKIEKTKIMITPELFSGMYWVNGTYGKI